MNTRIYLFTLLKELAGWAVIAGILSGVGGCKAAGYVVTGSAGVEHRDGPSHYVAKVSVSDSISLAN